MTHRLLCAWGALFSLWACSSDPESDSSGSLIEQESWRLVDQAEDRFWDDEEHDETHKCTEQDFEAEGESLEISTEHCNYITLEQSSLLAIHKGDRVHLALWWQTLVSAQPVEGHFAVYLGDTALFEEKIPIPGDADARDVDIVSPRDFPEGTPVTLHVHNHGSNSWSLGSLSLF